VFWMDADARHRRRAPDRQATGQDTLLNKRIE
jgi:hypothetical protein